MKIEPIYQLKIHGNSWIDQAKHGYEYNVKHGPAVVRIVYTEAQMRQLVEACAASCDAIAKGRNSVVGTRCADSVRRLIKELLP